MWLTEMHSWKRRRRRAWKKKEETKGKRSRSVYEVSKYTTLIIAARYCIK